MVVLPPASTLAQVASAVAAVALSALALAVIGPLSERLRVAKALKSLPGPKGSFLVGLTPQFVENIHRLHDFQVDMMRKYGGRLNIPWNIFTNNMLYLADPADVEHVLSTNVNNWIKSELFVASVREVFGKSLLGLNHAHTADGGAMCHLQRKLMAKVFTTNNFRAFTEGIFHQYALRLVERIKQQRGLCNMHEIASQYTLQTTFDIVCGVPLESFDKDLGLKFIASMDYVFESVAQRQLIQPYFQFLWWCMPSEYRLRRETKVMTQLVDSILEQRLREPDSTLAARSDVLSLFIKRAREEDAAAGATVLDMATLRSVVATLIFAGRDTTSSTILYAFYALAQYPDEQDKLLAELESVGSDALTFEDVKKLKYLDAFMWETLRLYPSIPSNIKQAAADDVFPDGTFIPAGTNIMYTSWYMGRNNAALWGDDQLVFRPDRWFTTMKRRPTAYELPVFQGGARICLGMNMALLEAKLFVITLLREFHVKIQDGEQLQDRPYIFGPTLTMVGGLPLELTPRAAARAH